MKISNQLIAIGIPCSFPTVPFPFFDSFTRMEKPGSYVFITQTNGAIDDLRNDIVQTAIDAHATHLIMMDVDQVYHPKTIPTLLSRNLPIVGAAVCRRYPPFDPIIMRLTDNGYEAIDEWSEDGVVECDATGTGCILFDMAIFKKLPKPWFKFRRNPDNPNMVIGEDIGLCQDLKALGYRIFVDTSVPAGHMTTMIVTKATHDLYRAMKATREAKEAAIGVSEHNEFGQKVSEVGQQAA